MQLLSTTEDGRIEALAPAKINLALHVTGRRDDGYHLIDTLAVFTEFGDRVTIVPGDADSLAVTGPFSRDLEAGPGNLVERARDLLRGLSGGHDCGPVAITLEKNLPVASGIGGGSSDAAATLRALNALWNLGCSAGQLAGIGRALGADVPMCVHARPLRARGAGEEITFVDGFAPLAMVLANPGTGVSTPAVFRALKEKDNLPLPDFSGVANTQGLVAWLRDSRNDLEAPARSLAPAIGDVLAELWRHYPLVARMSGSGATCFALFDDPETARQAETGLRTAHPDWFVAATTTLPSPGDNDARH